MAYAERMCPTGAERVHVTGGFGILPRDLIKARGLPAATKFLYGLLWDWGISCPDEAPTVAALAEAMEESPRTVKTRIAQLRERGYLASLTPSGSQRPVWGLFYGPKNPVWDADAPRQNTRKLGGPRVGDRGNQLPRLTPSPGQSVAPVGADTSCIKYEDKDCSADALRHNESEREKMKSEEDWKDKMKSIEEKVEARMARHQAEKKNKPSPRGTYRRRRHAAPEIPSVPVEAWSPTDLNCYYLALFRETYPDDPTPDSALLSKKGLSQMKQVREKVANGIVVEPHEALTAAITATKEFLDYVFQNHRRLRSAKKIMGPLTPGVLSGYCYDFLGDMTGSHRLRGRFSDYEYEPYTLTPQQIAQNERLLRSPACSEQACEAQNAAKKAEEDPGVSSGTPEAPEVQNASQEAQEDPQEVQERFKRVRERFSHAPKKGSRLRKIWGQSE